MTTDRLSHRGDPSAGHRPPRRAGRPPRTTLDTLVDAAVALGLDTFTIPAVAERVGIGESTVYGYVSSRHDLYAAAASSVFTHLDTSSDAPTWAEFVDTIAERALALAARHPGLRDYILWGPYTPETVATFEALIDRVRGYLPGIPDVIAWALASRPVVLSLSYQGDPVLEPLTPWLRRALIAGLDATVSTGDLPDVGDLPWLAKLRPTPPN